MRCKLCNLELGQITWTHLKKAHNTTVGEYLKVFPDDKVFSHSLDSKEKMSKAKKGKPSRRKGLTIVEEYGEERAKEISEKMSLSRVEFRGEKHPFFGHHHSIETKGKISKKNKGQKRPKTSEANIKYYLDNPEKAIAKGIQMRDGHTEETGRKISAKQKGIKKPNTSITIRRKILEGDWKIPTGNIWKHGYRDDLGHFVRSSWEANVCRVLNFLGKKYLYESKECRFNLGNNGALILDLYLPEDKMWIEVKGYLKKETLEKLKIFIELFPNESSKVSILDMESYKLLETLFKNKIERWE
jgi:hypothetical protein